MEYFNEIEAKLIRVIRLYYLNRLIRNTVLFVVIVFSYVFLATFLERFIWFSSTARIIILLTMLLCTAALFYFYILRNIFRYFSIYKTISYDQIAQLIGNEIDDVDDKLYNLIQLSQKKENNEFIIRAIEQKSKELRPFNFKQAIDFRKSIGLLRYLLIPIAVIGILYATNELHSYLNSLNRIKSYSQEYIKPAPFTFELLNENLYVKNNQPIEIQVSIKGEYTPETAQIVYNDKSYYLKKTTDHIFKHQISDITENMSFRFASQDYFSKTYQIVTQKTPTIKNIEIALDYPSYTGKKDETPTNQNFINVPRGTLMKWNIKTQDANRIKIETKDTTLTISPTSADEYQWRYKAINNTDIYISSSNDDFQDYETINYKIKSTKDRPPYIKVLTTVDSIPAGNRQYHKIVLKDDYGLRDLRMVYYPIGTTQSRTKRLYSRIEKKMKTYYVQFSEQVPMQEGVNYSYYFEVYDNSAVGNHTKSQLFSTNKLTEQQQNRQRLEKYNKNMKALDQLLQNKDLTQKMTKSKEIKDREALDFFNKESHNQSLMKKFTRELKRELEDKKDLDPTVKENIERELKKIQTREKLLKQLEKYNKNLSEKNKKETLEKYQQSSKMSKKNMQQILEYMKKKYVREKLQQAIDDIDKLSKEITKDTLHQEQHQEKYKDILKQLDSVSKTNDQLRRKETIERDLEQEQKTKDQLDQTIDQKKDVEKQNKDISRQLQKMKSKLQKSKKESQSMEMKIDLETARQVLDNLLVLSFRQEDVLDNVKVLSNKDNIGEILKKQNKIKELFVHVDDSIYALSLRQPKVSTVLNTHIQQTYRYIDGALENLASMDTNNTSVNQHQSLYHLNELAKFISDMINNMQMDMSDGKGKGQQSDPQLSDIIKQQKSLKDNAEQKMKQRQGKPSEEESEEEYEIYKQQEKIKQELKKLAEKNGGKGKPLSEIAKEIDQQQEELLDSGVTDRLRKQIQETLKKLLDMDNATYIKGQKEERKSNTSKKEYTPEDIKMIFDRRETDNYQEQLIRQQLPLNQKYNQMINNYFDGVNNL